MLMTMTTMKRSNSSPSNSLESPTSTTTSNTDFIFHPPNPPSDHHHYNNLIDFQAGPLLTFDHHRHSSSSSWDNYDAAASWDDHDHHHPLNVALNNVYVPTKRDGATFHNDTIANNKETTNTADHWLYPDPSTITSVAANSSDVVPHRKGNNHNHKRPNSGEISGQPQKKQSNGSAATNSKSTAKPVKSPSSSSPPISKDPQSVAAKNRRERISERLKVLQELVPNGSKVDMVTMLEKAIGYVKFLQLQVKVLATDEFWPAQGRKAPDITQVKEAIDAILSASRGRNKNSSNSSNSTSEEQEDEEEEE